MNNTLDGENKGTTNHIFNINPLLNALISQHKFTWLLGPGLGWGDWDAYGTKLGKH